MTKYALIGAVFAAAVMCGCSEDTAAGDRSRREAETAADRAKIQEREARESARRAWDARLTQLENRIKALREDARPQARKAREATEDTIDTLEAEARDLRSRLSTVDDKAADTWDKVKNSTEEAFGKLERKLDNWRDKAKRRLDK
jgi:chromosome segregation ATPase